MIMRSLVALEGWSSISGSLYKKNYWWQKKGLKREEVVYMRVLQKGVHCILIKRVHCNLELVDQGTANSFSDYQFSLRNDLNGKFLVLFSYKVNNTHCTPRRLSTTALEAGLQTAVHAKIHSLGGARRSE